MSIQIIEPAELRTVAGGSGIVGRVGVIYQVRTTGDSYKWNPATGVMEAMGGAVPGDGILVSASRTALASDNGQTLELAAGVTYTLSDAVALPAGVAFQGPVSGTAPTIAVTGSATTNGLTAAITVPVGKMATAIPRKSAPAAFLVSVQA